MPPRSARAPERDDDREPRHSDLMRALELGLRGVEVRAEARHEAVLQRFEAGDGRFIRIEDQIQKLAEGQAEANGAAKVHAPATEHDGGFPFKHGWRSWTVVTVAILTGLGALKAALLVMDAIGAGLMTAWHNITH